MDNRLFRRRSVAIDFPIFDDATDTLLGRMGDLSPAGFMVYGESPLQAETLYHLRVAYHDEQGQPKRARFKAKSMWNGRDANPALHATGFRFFDLDTPDASQGLAELLALFTIGEDDGEADD